jgi:hypothetical protein
LCEDDEWGSLLSDLHALLQRDVWDKQRNVLVQYQHVQLQKEVGGCRHALTALSASLHPSTTPFFSAPDGGGRQTRRATKCGRAMRALCAGAMAACSWCWGMRCWMSRR